VPRIRKEEPLRNRQNTIGNNSKYGGSGIHDPQKDSSKKQSSKNITINQNQIYI